MTSKVGHSIKNRKKANDVFITPLALAKSHIDMIDYEPDDRWLDSCKNSGSYYKQYPTDNKDYCEILDGKDFLDYNGKVDIICDNPPYSILDKWFKKVISLNPRVYSCLIGINNLTARRIEWFNNAGYGIKKLRMLKVFSWYGMSYIVVFEKGCDSIMEVDRKVWKEDEEEPKKKKVIKKKIKGKKEEEDEEDEVDYGAIFNAELFNY